MNLIMKISLFVNYFIVTTVYGANYIDNSNFDQMGEGWFVLADNDDCEYCTHRETGYQLENRLVDFLEEYRGNQIFDRCLVVKESNDPTVVYDLGSGVSEGEGLYFYVETGISGCRNNKDYMDVKVSLEDGAFGPISSKKMRIRGQDKVHVISSDYKAYKRCPKVSLKIKYKPHDDCALEIYYAQVGTDPQSLGGRGPRKKSW